MIPKWYKMTIKWSKIDPDNFKIASYDYEMVSNKLLQPGLQTVWFPEKMPYGEHYIAVFAFASSFSVLVFVIFLSRVLNKIIWE